MLNQKQTIECVAKKIESAIKFSMSNLMALLQMMPFCSVILKVKTVLLTLGNFLLQESLHFSQCKCVKWDHFLGLLPVTL